MAKLSEAEYAALEILKEAGGCILITRIPDKNLRGVFGEIEPGIGVYKKLEKKGLLYFTEQDPDDEFQFTQDVYITEEGEAVLKQET